MIGAAILLAQTLATAPAEHVVVLDDVRWASAAATRPQKVSPGQRVWVWSDRCAPAVADAGATEFPCATARRVVVTASKARKPIARAEIVWGTSALLDEVPEHLLPRATAGEDGVVSIAAPLMQAIYVRLEGPRDVSGWQKVDTASERVRLTGVTATDVVIEATDDGLPAVKTRAYLADADASSTDVPRLIAAEKGTLRFRVGAAGTSRMTIWSAASAPAERVADNDRLGGTVSLPPGCGIRGTFVTSEGRAVEHASASSLFALGTTGRSTRRRTTSDADGRFELRGLPCGTSIFMAARDSFASLRRDLKLADATLDLKRIVLEPARTARVRVVDEKQQPISGVRVRVVNAPVYATSAKDGVVTLEAVGGDELEIETSADDYLPATARIATTAKEMPVVRLSRAAIVTVSVTRSDTKQPAGPGSVAIDLSGRKWIVPFGSDGRIRFSALRGGSLKLDVRVPGLASHKLPAREISAGEDADMGSIALEAGAVISGTIVDAATAAPLQARVRTPRPNAAGLRLSVVMKDWIETTTDENGHFEIGGLDAGDYRLLVEAPGFGPVLTQHVTATKETPGSAGTIELSPGHRVAITCRPARRCGSKSQLLLGDPNDDWAALSGAMTNGAGEILRAPRGHHRLQLLDRGAVVAEKEIDVRDEAPETAIDIALREIAVEGQVVRGGRAVSGGMVQFVGARPNGGIPIFIDKKLDTAVVGSEIVGGVGRSAVVPVDDRGSFSTRELAPGVYTVQYSGSLGSSPEREVTIPDAEAFRVRVELPATTLTGRVVDETGKIPEWARIELRNGGTIVTSSDMTPEGRFAIDGASAGTVTIHAYNDGAEIEREVTIAGDRETQIDLVLRPKQKTRLTLAATDARGSARGGAKLFLACDGGMMSSDADMSGTASFTIGSRALSCFAAALSASDGWAFTGPFRPSSNDSSPVSVRFSGHAATLAIATQTTSVFGIATSNGFPLDRTFPLIGWPSLASPEQPARLRGLPPGTYVVRLANGATRSVAIDGTRDVTIDF